MVRITKIHQNMLLHLLILLSIDCLAIEFNNKNGTDPDPPLISAVLRGNISSVQELLAKGADPDEINHANGWNALHVAANNSEDGQMVKLLLANGAHIDKRTEGERGVRSGSKFIKK